MEEHALMNCGLAANDLVPYVRFARENGAARESVKAGIGYMVHGARGYPPRPCQAGCGR